MISPRSLKESYECGLNISALLRSELNVEHNTKEIIEISYDLQTGSYINAMSSQKMAKHKQEYSSEIAKIVLSLCKPETIMEAGVGEATTLSGVINALEHVGDSYGFDLSWSRAAYAKNWLNEQNVNNAGICTGDLLNIPFLDNAIDVVYTSHSIEPNGGLEVEILQELYRVTRKYLILLEPGYELGGAEAKERMVRHGYCKGLKQHTLDLGYKVLEHKLFLHTVNPLNPTALTIIEKNSHADQPDCVYACPKFKTPLTKEGSHYYSPEAMVVYPILKEIPCLRIENGILASKFMSVD